MSPRILPTRGEVGSYRRSVTIMNPTWTTSSAITTSRAGQLLEGYKYTDLKDRKIPLEDHERAHVMKRGAHWNDGTIGIWKARSKSGDIVYGCNTHRAVAIKDTLGKAIKAFPFIRSTS